jgi:hypothetical protein
VSRAVLFVVLRWLFMVVLLTAGIAREQTTGAEGTRSFDAAPSITVAAGDKTPHSTQPERGALLVLRTAQRSPFPPQVTLPALPPRARRRTARGKRRPRPRRRIPRLRDDAEDH